MSAAPARRMCTAAIARSSRSYPARRAICWVSLLLLQAFASRGGGATVRAAAFTDACAKACGAFEFCFLYENAEFCAQECAPGRCDADTETCVLQGVDCAQAPCLPVAVCEPRAVDDVAAASATASSDDSTSGASNSSACARTCPMLDSPVCATDGTSYANMCFFEAARCRDPGISLLSRGLCAPDRALNLFAFNNASSGSSASPSASDGSSAACDAIVCADVDDPVCSSSGTLRNLCFLKREQCKLPSVQLLRPGACEPVLALMPRCPASCTQEFVPVCASNGWIYANECLFRQARCARPFTTGFVARDLSECELDIGDSTSTVQDFRSVITSVFD